jgi:hypothetical protein
LLSSGSGVSGSEIFGDESGGLAWDSAGLDDVDARFSRIPSQPRVKTKIRRSNNAATPKRARVEVN